MTTHFHLAGDHNDAYSVILVQIDNTKLPLGTRPAVPSAKSVSTEVSRNPHRQRFDGFFNPPAHVLLTSLLVRRVTLPSTTLQNESCGIPGPVV